MADHLFWMLYCFPLCSWNGRVSRKLVHEPSAALKISTQFEIRHKTDYDRWRLSTPDTSSCKRVLTLAVAFPFALGGLETPGHLTGSLGYQTQSDCALPPVTSRIWEVGGRRPNPRSQSYSFTRSPVSAPHPITISDELLSIIDFPSPIPSYRVTEQTLRCSLVMTDWHVPPK